MYVEMWNVTWVAAHWENAKLKSKKEKKNYEHRVFYVFYKAKKNPPMDQEKMA